MERLDNQRPGGIGGNALRTWGLLFLTVGAIGRGLLQTRLMGIGSISPEELLAAMEASQNAMILATVSLVLQAMETCAAPIFALLLTEGAQKTSNYGKYGLRVTGLALLCEIPYNLAINGTFFYMDSRNPVFGLVLSMVLLYFYRRYGAPGMKHLLIKAVVTVAAFLWGQMLRIEYGACMVLIVAVLWAFRKNVLYRNFAGAAVTVVCTAISPFFLAAPMGFLAVHAYNGEAGTNSRIVNYLAYPVILLAIAAVGMLMG